MKNSDNEPFLYILKDALYDIAITFLSMANNLLRNIHSLRPYHTYGYLYLLSSKVDIYLTTYKWLSFIQNLHP